ncbi:MAG TPA: LPS assembly protein LptD [Acidisarcina sp.]|nr:LPS assembly protein LptD [Acidisarcina sp.]
MCITLLFLCHPLLWSQQLTKEFPQSTAGTTTSADAPGQPQENADATPLPDAPSASHIPVAEPEAVGPTGVPVRIRANEQKKQGDNWSLTGEVVIEYRDYILRADRIHYNAETEQAEAEGHVQVEGGPDDELINASHGTVNFDQQTGHFYDVIGTIGVRHSGHKSVYTSANPFLFTGKEVIKTGPRGYRVIDGSMTSCRLPKPDWRLLAKEISVEEDQARAVNTTFRLLGIPVFFLPYVTHPVSTTGRQSGFLIPTFGTSTTKGTILGESIFWAINRNTDLTLGSEYYSKRGWAPNGQFRYRGFDRNFFTLRFHSMLDRSPEIKNQGGLDMMVSGRRDFSEHSRAVTNIEYLSSYIYRQAFTETFANAVNSEVKSNSFLVHSSNGRSASVNFDRYQSFQSTAPGDEIRILHLPSLRYEAVDEPLGRTPFYWGLTTSLAGLSRAEPSFQTSHEVGRLDIYPHVSLPMHFDGWTLRPQVGIRNTFYSKSQRPGTVPTERGATLNRLDLEAGMEIRPPVLERDFTSGWLVSALHREIRHTIEPVVQYNFVGGIDNFHSTLRFDDTDIASDTNEVAYSLTQRFFTRTTTSTPCAPATGKDPGTNPENCGQSSREWITWKVGQKYFIDPNFGGALTPGQRNLLATTLDLTGVAFLVYPRDISPVISRLRARTTEHTDLEWDLDYDTRAGRVESSNIFADYRSGNLVAGVGHARLNAPEQANVIPGKATPRNTTSGYATSGNAASGSVATVSNFNQLRVFAGYGSLARKGLNLAGNMGYDFAQNALEYVGAQTTYNWDCCGLSFEYNRFALGSVRTENQYRFNFSLAGVGTAGNLRRAERLF